ncbi:MAG: MFS transporter [Bacteroidota bacterium]
MLYGIGGLITLISGPLLGQLVDRFGQVRVFVGGTLLAGAMVISYTLIQHINWWILMIIHSLLFIGTTARMVSSTALAILVPAAEKRGAFMLLDASIQQLAAGLSAVLAGWIVLEAIDGQLTTKL